MRWVWGEKVEAGPSMRSALPCPNIIRDALPEPLQHMANGKMYDSKRAMEKADREAGCICVGNEQPKNTECDPLPPIKDDVIEAYQKVKAGYKPEPQIEKNLPTESGWS